MGCDKSSWWGFGTLGPLRVPKVGDDEPSYLSNGTICAQLSRNQCQRWGAMNHRGGVLAFWSPSGQWTLG